MPVPSSGWAGARGLRGHRGHRPRHPGRRRAQAQAWPPWRHPACRGTSTGCSGFSIPPSKRCSGCAAHERPGRRARGPPADPRDLQSRGPRFHGHVRHRATDSRGAPQVVRPPRNGPPRAGRRRGLRHRGLGVAQSVVRPRGVREGGGGVGLRCRGIPAAGRRPAPAAGARRRRAIARGTMRSSPGFRRTTKRASAFTRCWGSLSSEHCARSG